MKLSFVLLVLLLCAVWDSLGDGLLKKQNGYSFGGPATHAYITESLFTCSKYCNQNSDCLAMKLIGNLCRLYGSGSNMMYSPSSSLSDVFLNLNSLARPTAPAVAVPGGPWGSWTSMAYCDPNFGVNAINVWYAYFVNNILTPDDEGVTEVELICSKMNGGKGSSLKLGRYNPAADKRSLKCPINSFIWAVRFMIMPGQGGSDDASMVGLSAMCNDINNTTKNLASGEGTSIYPWGSWLSCNPGYVICGFALLIEADNSDNTNVNAMNIVCCVVT